MNPPTTSSAAPTAITNTSPIFSRSPTSTRTADSNANGIVLSTGLRFDDYHPTLSTRMSDVRLQNIIIQHPMVRALIIPECDMEARRRCMILLSSVLVAATPVLHEMTAFSHRSQELGQDPTATTKLLVEQYNHIISLIAKTNPSNTQVLFWLAHHLQNLEKKISVLCPNLPLLPKPILRPAMPDPASSTSSTSTDTPTASSSGTSNASAENINNKKQPKKEQHASPQASKVSPLTPPPLSASGSPLDVSPILAPFPTEELYTRIHESKIIIQDLSDRIQGAVCMVFWESWDAVYELVSEIVGYQVVASAEKGRIFRSAGPAAMYIASKKKETREREEMKVRMLKTLELQEKQSKKITNSKTNPTCATGNVTNTNDENLTTIDNDIHYSPSNIPSPVLSPPDQSYFEPLKKYRLSMYTNLYQQPAPSKPGISNNTFVQANTVNNNDDGTSNKAPTNFVAAAENISPNFGKIQNELDSSDINMGSNQNPWPHKISSGAETRLKNSKAPSSTFSKSPTTKTKKPTKRSTSIHSSENIGLIEGRNDNKAFKNMKPQQDQFVKPGSSGLGKSSILNSGNNGQAAIEASITGTADLPFVDKDDLFDQDMFMQNTFFENTDNTLELQDFPGMPEMPNIPDMNLSNLNMGINMGINMGLASLGLNMDSSNETTEKSDKSNPNITGSGSTVNNKNHQSFKSPNSFDSASMNRSSLPGNFDMLGMRPHRNSIIDSGKSRSNSISTREFQELVNGNRMQRGRTNSGFEGFVENNDESRNSSISESSISSSKRSNSVCSANDGNDSFSNLRKRIRLLEEMEDHENTRRRARQQHFQAQQRLQKFQNMQSQYQQHEKNQKSSFTQQSKILNSLPPSPTLTRTSGDASNENDYYNNDTNRTDVN